MHFFSAPKSKTFIIGSFSVLKLITCFFVEMPHFLWSDSENGSILGHFKKLCKCYHMTKSSFTCFLEHFILPPVNQSNVEFSWTSFDQCKKIRGLFTYSNAHAKVKTWIFDFRFSGKWCHLNWFLKLYNLNF